MSMIKGIAAGLGLVTILALAGCAPAVTLAQHTHAATPSATPTPTPTPTAPPALSELVLSPDGLGPLVIGSPVPDESPATAVVLWNPTKCGTTGAWLPNYPDGPLGPDGDPTGAPFYFAVDHKTDSLTYINVRSTQIKTTTGISIGSNRQQLLAAYPHFDAIVKSHSTDLYEIRGPKAQLVIEVKRPGADGSGVAWDNTVVLMEVGTIAAGVGSLYGNDAGGGVCPAP